MEIHDYVKMISHSVDSIKMAMSLLQELPYETIQWFPLVKGNGLTTAVCAEHEVLDV